jgi:hypothetical protein
MAPGQPSFLAPATGLGYVVPTPTSGQEIRQREDPMSIDQQDQEALYEEANRLYWESNRSVNQIGEALDLSKGVLYSLIEALPAGLPCPDCGEEMVFPNRTAREKGFLACPECGMEEEEAAIRAFWEEQGESMENEDEASTHPLARRAGEAVQQVVESGRARVADLSPRGRVLTGTALLGIAAGLALGAYFRKR